jgi:hypothetical protein
MSKKRKYDFNGTLLNLVLLGGAAVILKNRTGSLRGVGAIKKRYILSTTTIMDNGEFINTVSKIIEGKTRAFDALKFQVDIWGKQYPYKKINGPKFCLLYKDINNITADCIIIHLQEEFHNNSFI